MKIIRLIDETRERWRIELKECRDALLNPPQAKPNPLDRLAVELDYLLVEAKRAIAQLETENKELLNTLQNNLTHRKFAEMTMKKD